MVQRVYSSPYVSAKRWLDRFPVRQYAYPGSQTPISSISRSISTSAVDRAPARPRAPRFNRKQTIYIVQQGGLKDKLYIGVVGGLFLLGCYTVYCVRGYYRALMKSVEGAWDKASSVLVDAGGKAKDISRTVRDGVEPTVKKASENLSENARKASGGIKGAASSTQSAIKPHWEWIGRKVEEWRK